MTLAVYEGAIRLAVGSANLTAAGYRHNREAALVIEANARRGSEAKLLQRALAPMRDRLRPWWGSDDAERALSIAETRLKPWAQGATADDDATFLWSGADDPLVARFVAMWPRGERVRRIRIVSSLLVRGRPTMAPSPCSSARSASAAPRSMAPRSRSSARPRPTPSPRGPRAPGVARRLRPPVSSG